LSKTKNISLEELYITFFDDLFRYSFSLLRNKEDAEDVVQEIFTKHFENPEHYRGDCSIKTWLFTLTRNCCFDKMKKKKIFHSETESDIVDNAYNPVFRIEAKMVLQEALKLLTPEQNELLFLKDYAGYSYLEISELTGLSLENVKIKLFRTRKKLKDIINE